MNTKAKAVDPNQVLIGQFLPANGRFEPGDFARKSYLEANGW